MGAWMKIVPMLLDIICHVLVIGCLSDQQNVNSYIYNQMQNKTIIQSKVTSNMAGVERTRKYLESGKEERKD